MADHPASIGVSGSSRCRSPAASGEPASNASKSPHSTSSALAGCAPERSRPTRTPSLPGPGPAARRHPRRPRPAACPETAVHAGRRPPATEAVASASSPCDGVRDPYLCKDKAGKFRFRLRASNGQVIAGRGLLKQGQRAERDRVGEEERCRRDNRRPNNQRNRRTNAAHAQETGGWKDPGRTVPLRQTGGLLGCRAAASLRRRG